ncbi:MAG: twin-arginine translocase subunit TatB [Dehalococcoidia bacterium]|nr:twin-arginine translocase subunit TatB [Dehalococcoidia bacterium]
MEFLGVGYQEVLLILVLMLVVVGPERLPGMAYQIGRAVRQMQQYARAVRSEFNEEISYLEEQYKTVKGDIDDTRHALRQQQAQFEQELREAKSSLAVPELTSPPTNVINLSDVAGREPPSPPTAVEPPPASVETKGGGAPAAPLVF